MKSQWDKLAEAIDFQVENRREVILKGRPSGFDALLKFQAPQKLLELTIAAKPQNESERVMLVSFLQHLRELNKPVKATSYENNRLCISILFGLSWKQAAKNINKVLGELTQYLSDNRYENCCGICDATGTASYVINDSCDFLCGSCYGKVVNALEHNRMESETKQSNLPMGLVGAVLGSLLGVVIWIIIGKLGFIAGIAGLAIMSFGFKGYAFFDKNPTKASIIMVVALSAVMIIFAEWNALAIEIYSAFGPDYGLNYFDCFQAVPDFLSEPEIRNSVLYDIVIGYLLTALSTYSYVRQLLRTTTGDYVADRKSVV